MSPKSISLTAQKDLEVRLPDTGLVVQVQLGGEEKNVLSRPQEASDFAWLITSSLQDSDPATASTVLLVWPTNLLSTNELEYSSLVTEITKGVVQSAQLDLGAKGVRVNLLLAFENQLNDINRTLQYFHSDEGSFAAGCTFDLREDILEGH